MDAANSNASGPDGARKPAPTDVQRQWLRRGLLQPGGKLPLFDEFGQKVPRRTVRSCIDHGWARPWFRNPLKPDWLVCRLTDEGRAAAVLGEEDHSSLPGSR